MVNGEIQKFDRIYGDRSRLDFYGERFAFTSIFIESFSLVVESRIATTWSNLLAVCSSIWFWGGWLTQKKNIHGWFLHNISTESIQCFLYRLFGYMLVRRTTQNFTYSIVCIGAAAKERNALIRFLAAEELLQHLGTTENTGDKHASCGCGGLVWVQEWLSQGG